MDLLPFGSHEEEDSDALPNSNNFTPFAAASEIETRE
jgi:hypothetical protein